MSVKRTRAKHSELRDLGAQMRAFGESETAACIAIKHGCLPQPPGCCDHPARDQPHRVITRCRGGMHTEQIFGTPTEARRLNAATRQGMVFRQYERASQSS